MTKPALFQTFRGRIGQTPDVSRAFIFLSRKIDMLDVLRISALLSLILMVITFFTACANKNDQADSNSIVREPDKGREIHGEVGAMYGQGISRR